MDGTGLQFSDFVAALPSDIESIVVSYPNDPAMGYTELERVARASLPSQPFVLLGESFSGPIAISIAASAPPGLCGLVLCCSFVSNPHPALGWLTRIVPVRVPIAISSWLLLGRFSSKRLRSSLVRVLTQVTPATLRARLAQVLAVDVTAKLARVRVPVIYLRATADRVVPRSASALVAHSLPATAVAELEGPHFLLQAVPTVASHYVGGFVHRVAVGP
jgi:pimeloyl-ACP methyl ester carboxylesterase